MTNPPLADLLRTVQVEVDELLDLAIDALGDDAAHYSDKPRGLARGIRKKLAALVQALEAPPVDAADREWAAHVDGEERYLKPKALEAKPEPDGTLMDYERRRRNSPTEADIDARIADLERQLVEATRTSQTNALTAASFAERLAMSEHVLTAAQAERDTYHAEVEAVRQQIPVNMKDAPSPHRAVEDLRMAHDQYRRELQQLREAHERLRVALAHLHTITFSADMPGRFVLAEDVRRLLADDAAALTPASPATCQHSWVVQAGYGVRPHGSSWCSKCGIDNPAASPAKEPAK